MYLSLHIFFTWESILFLKRYIFMKFCLVPQVQELHTSPLTLMFSLMEKHSSTALSINACPNMSAFMFMCAFRDGLHSCTFVKSLNLLSV